MWLFSYVKSDAVMPIAAGSTKKQAFEYAKRYFRWIDDVPKSKEFHLKWRGCEDGEWAIEDENGYIYGWLTQINTIRKK